MPVWLTTRGILSQPREARISLAAFSAIMMVGAFVFPDTISGITDIQ